MTPATKAIGTAVIGLVIMIVATATGSRLLMDMGTLLLLGGVIGAVVAAVRRS